MSPVRNNEALDVSSVTFFLEGPSLIPLTAVNLLADCPPTAATYPDQHRYNREEELWCFHANRNSSVQWK